MTKQTNYKGHDTTVLRELRLQNELAIASGSYDKGTIYIGRNKILAAKRLVEMGLAEVISQLDAGGKTYNIIVKITKNGLEKFENQGE